MFKQIRQLEEELGTKLYERIGKLLVVTPVGQVIVSYGHSILRQHDEAIVTARELGGIKRGNLHFGCGAHTSICITPPLLRAFLALYPKLEVSVTTRGDHSLLNELHEGRVDVFLMTSQLKNSDLKSIPSGNTKWCLWSHLATRSRNCEQLRGTSGQAFHPLSSGNVIETAIRCFCDQVGFDPKVVMDDDQADSLKELVKLGLGISLLPLWSVSEDVRRGELRILRLKDRQLFHQMGLVHRTSTYHPGVLSALS